MKKQTRKYVVLAIFALLIVVSVILFGQVKINYNISDYLDESTETKISLNIMENEFGTTGNIQVMVEDVTLDQAYQICDIIKAVPNVLLVNFDPTDENYFKKDGDKTGHALFAVIVDGDEYSPTASEVLENIRGSLDELFEGKTNYGGAVVEKTEMRNTMKKEIVIILVIAVVFAMGIMLIMANSWLEPVVLLVSSGVAVLINMGTNAIFGEISYITNSVAAILQLALSVDYSIVLLHNFRALKLETDDKHDAMRKAVKVTFKPVLASAATTIAGLLALLFMTMKIGFDIGIVLTKGITISMLTALTLLPALLLVCDKIMQKTSKKDLVIGSKKFCKIAFKGGKVALLLAFALIVACGGLQFNNTYSFTDTANPNEKINDTFGSGNTIVVVYPNERVHWEEEAKLAGLLEGFKTADGYAPFKNYTSYSSTVLEEYTIQEAAVKLNIPEALVKILFGLYHSDSNNPETKEILPIEFVNYAVEFLASNEGNKNDYADEETLHTLQILSRVYDIVNNELTADEMYELVSTGVMSDIELNEFQVKQMYGLYLWDEFDNDAVDFETMLDFMVEMSQDEDGKKLMSSQTIEDLSTLADGLEEFKEKMGTRVDKEAFLEFGYENFGDAGWVKLACNAVFKLVQKDDDGMAKIVDILRLVGKVRDMLPEEYAAMIENYTYVYDVIDEECPYGAFLPRLQKVILALSNEEREIEPTVNDVQQAYIMYFHKIDAIPDEKIDGMLFVNFVNEQIDKNPTVGNQISEDSKLMLQDVVIVDKFVSDEGYYNYVEMTELLNKLRNDVQSIAPSSGDSALTTNAVYAIYMGYAATYEEGMGDPIVALRLLEYVDEHKDDPNHTLYEYMTSETKAMIEERKQALLSAEKLFLGENYNRMLISVDLPLESEDSSRFVEYLMDAVREVYGKEAHVAGGIVSTYELQQTFEHDNQLITIFTIISIFVIILLIFRSLSLPIVLVAVIQGAIWISMSLSLITGPMFFMSYIIATCILMGSTIDYGILMSTNYLDYRKTMDKKEALLHAVKSAIPTVFTSGLILTICGFIVGMVASLTSISTVGFLLGKGTLVSVLMIMLVLPSILYLLDGFIIKFTHRMKTKEERRERRAKRKTKKLSKKTAKKEKKLAKKTRKSDKKAARKAKRAKQ